MGKRQKFDLRLPPDQMVLMKRTAQIRGFRSANAYVQAVVVNDMRDATSDQTDREAFVASLDRLTKEIRTIHTAQQALFALVDSLARLFLTCIPEPPPNALDQAQRLARLRYDKFLLSVAQNMTKNTPAALTDMVDSRS
jgi:hypothetical protein